MAGPDQAVTVLRPFLIVFMLFACCVAWPPTAAAQALPWPAKTEPGTPDQSVARPMVFYEAHGQANACGEGCSDWIAANGKIVVDTADRLRHLLAKIHGPKPPIFFHSPGGSVKGSLELGRLIRAQKMTVSVGHTIPLNCDNAAGWQSCAEQMSDRLQVDAVIDPLTAMCNSACVYTLAGGVTRIIPPWATLGIHDVSVDPTIRHNPRYDELVEKEAGVLLHSYLHQMGINTELLNEAFAIPSTTIGRLSRDDTARLGLDTREFGETPWIYIDKPSPRIATFFFLRTTRDKSHYINGIVNLTCTTQVKPFNYYVLAYGRDPLPGDDRGATFHQGLFIYIDRKQIPFAWQANAKLYVRSAKIYAPVMNDIVTDNQAMVLPGTEFGREQTTGDITLTTTGFAETYATLKDVCTQSLPQTAALTQLATKLPWFGGGQAVQPRLYFRLVKGTKRAAVDATLGAPVQTLQKISLYIDLKSTDTHTITAGYFDDSESLQRIARYVLKNEKIIDQITQTALTEGEELPVIRSLLSNHAAERAR